MIKIFKEENFKLFFKENKLLTLRLDLINKCNFRCVMCHYSSKSIRSRPKVLVSLDDFIQLTHGVESVMLQKFGYKSNKYQT